MKRIWAFVLSLLLCFSCMNLNVYAVGFGDVNHGDWFYSDVSTAYDRGWVRGYDDGTFRPNNPVTWAEAITMVIRAYKSPIPDVSGPWYSGVYSVAKSHNLLKYQEELAYNNANEPISRVDLCRLIYIEAGYDLICSNKVDYNAFVDLNYANLWESVPVNTLANIGVLNGYAENGKSYVKPNQNVTRAELCALLSRAVSKPKGKFTSKYSPKLKEALTPNSYNPDFFGVYNTPVDSFVVVERGKKAHKGIESNPLSVYASDYEVYSELLKAVQSGDYIIHLDAEGCHVNDISKSVGKILERLTSVYRLCHPMYMGTYGTSYNYQYNSVTGEVTKAYCFISCNEKDFDTNSVLVKNCYNDYLELVQYVRNDLSKLYASGDLNNRMSDKEKALVVAEYIANNTKYDESIYRGGNSENSICHNPMGFYKGWDLVCDAYSGLFNVFMWELGIESYMVGSSNHAWNICKLDGEWLHCDVTFADPVIMNYDGRRLHDFNPEWIAKTYSEMKSLKSNSSGDRNLSAESRDFLNIYLGAGF